MKTSLMRYLWTLLGAAGWLLFFAVTLALPIEAPAPSLISQIASILLGVILLLVFLLAGEQPRWPAIARWLMFIAGLLAIAVPFAFNWHAPPVRAFTGLGIVLLALPIGYWIGDRMEKVTNLVPLAVAMSMADIFSVFHGLSRRVVQDLTEHQQKIAEATAAAMSTVPPEEAEQAAREAAAAIRAPLGDYIVVHLPVAGTGATVPVLGIGDFIILAFLFRAAWVHGISPVKMFSAGIISLLIALGLSQAIQRPLPALPFIGLGTVGYLWLTEPRMRRLSRQEIVLSIVVALLFAALILGNWLLSLMGAR